jgi:predicted Zn-dependent protease
MEPQSLRDATEALEQGRPDDAVAFLRAAVREAEAAGDAEALAAAAALARAIGTEEARVFGESLAPPDAASEWAQPRLAGLGVLVALLIVVASVATLQLGDRVLGPPLPTEKHFTDEHPQAAALTGRTVYLVPLGRFEAVDLADLAASVEELYGIDAEILPTIGLRPLAYDLDREQLDAGGLSVILQAHYRADDPTVVVGLTDFDMYAARRPEREWVAWTTAGNFLVVSAARLGPGLLDRALLRDPTASRVRKIVAYEAGRTLLLGETPYRPRSIDPLSAGALDRVDSLDERNPLGNTP